MPTLSDMVKNKSRADGRFTKPKPRPRPKIPKYQPSQPEKTVRMTKLDPSETMRRLEAAVQEAREFFGIDPLWETPIKADGSDGAEITMHVGYLSAPITVNLDFFQSNPERIREYMCHEVAHIVSVEVNRLRSVLPPEYRDVSTPAGHMFNDALECLTTRLERVFLRERPASNSP